MATSQLITTETVINDIVPSHELDEVLLEMSLKVPELSRVSLSSLTVCLC